MNTIGANFVGTNIRWVLFLTLTSSQAAEAILALVVMRRVLACGVVAKG